MGCFFAVLYLFSYPKARTNLRRVDRAGVNFLLRDIAEHGKRGFKPTFYAGHGKRFDRGISRAAILALAPCLIALRIRCIKADGERIDDADKLRQNVPLVV